MFKQEFHIPFNKNMMICARLILALTNNWLKEFEIKSEDVWRRIMELSVGLNKDKNIMKMENPCTGTFLLLNKKEAIKLKKDLDVQIKQMIV